MEMMVYFMLLFIAFFNGGMLLMQNRAPKTKYIYAVPLRVFEKEYFQYLLHPFMTAFLNVLMVL